MIYLFLILLGFISFIFRCPLLVAVQQKKQPYNQNYKKKLPCQWASHPNVTIKGHSRPVARLCLKAKFVQAQA